MSYQVTLKDMNDNGDFPCPKCNETISPDDENGENYQCQLMNPFSDKEYVLLIHKCGAEIHIRWEEEELEA